MDITNRNLTALSYSNTPLSIYKAYDLTKMIEETRPDEVIITTPMTIDEVRCRRILETVERTAKRVRVRINYRYAPHNKKAYDLLVEGVIGGMTSIHFEWALNTGHGADYFRRWHRDKRNTGSLLIRKSTHHFNLIIFWLRSYEVAKKDPSELHLEEYEQSRKLCLKAEHEDACYRDQSVFSGGINMKDTLGVSVNCKSGAMLSYSLAAYSPSEGFWVPFNWTEGRLELDIAEKSYFAINLRPLFKAPRKIEAGGGLGRYGGGDPVLLDDLFGDGGDEDRFRRAADHIDGARSILTSMAANRFLRSEGVVVVKDVLYLKEFGLSA
ncbi:putative oxidoreductase yteT [Calycina marina]|uniref:Oxidoreductase yteT n=1 Tax=Calycina marina TaxID=1763456 RepID=A0A9P7YUR6_9HELO|nr:putative oxidoreductase yteT [Calycina marina]